MKFEHTDVWGFEHAIRGMRNPMNSWEKSDSGIGCNLSDVKLITCKNCSFNPNWCGKIPQNVIGSNDLTLAQKLIKAGPEHRKFLRQIFLSVDITAPLYWWKEFDTYKIGTVANSTSTMHKLESTEITPNCFEHDAVIEDLEGYAYPVTVMGSICNLLENYRQTYLRTKDMRVWRALIQLLPESWLQTRTITMTYENLYTIVRQRKNHKLIEWSEWFVNWVRSLPYAEELIFYGIA